MSLTLVVAVGRGGAIGAAGRLPWHAPEDLAHFRSVTMGHTLVLGRVTWESIGRPLPGRRMVVVSRRELRLPAGVVAVGSPADALEVARSTDLAPCVVGGAQIYDALIDDVTELHLTEVDLDVDGADAFFHLRSADWDEVEARRGSDARLTFRRYRRRGAGGGSPCGPVPGP